MSAPGTPSKKIESKSSDLVKASKKLEPAFYAKARSEIKYAEQPGPKAKYEKIPIKKFAAARKLEWTETMQVSPELRDKIWKDKKYSKKAATQIEERLHNPLDLMIVKVNDTIGEGLAVPPDSKAIPLGTIVAIHAAEIEDTSGPATNQYTLGLVEKEHQQSVVADSLKRPRSNATFRRGVSSYITDAASRIELMDSRLDPTALSNVLEENVIRVPCIYKGCSTSVYITLRDIQPGELITCAYGGTFWGAGGRCILNKDYEIIGHFDEDDQMVLDASYKPSAAMAAPRADFSKARPIIKPFLQGPPVDGFDYQQRFIADVSLALEVFAGRCAKDSSEEKFIDRLKNEFLKEATADKPNLARAYNALHKGLTDKAYDSVNTVFAPLRAELIFHMENYQKGKKLATELSAKKLEAEVESAHAILKRGQA